MLPLLRNSLLGILLCPALASAQQQPQVYSYRESDHVKVFNGATQRSAPWMGGLTAPQFAMADLNRDGKTDLVIYEKFADTVVRTFLNTGIPGAPFYTYAPQYAKNFPGINAYLKLQDYNCDNIPDLFHRGGTGISVWRGYYNSANELSFAPYKELFYPRYKSNGTPKDTLNAYIEATDVPAFVDVDKDGDLDFFGFAISGSVIYWYKNYQVEQGLPCDSIRIELKSACWGKTQQLLTRQARMAFTCGPEPLGGGGIVGPDLGTSGTSAKTTMHGGNTLCFLDYDGDGDYDYLNGNFAYNDIQLLYNGKAQYNTGRDSIVTQDTLWQANGVRFSMPVFPAAFHMDYDGDGKKDLVISANGGPDEVKNWNNVWWYRNTGTDAVPQFQFVKDSLLLDNSIDAGRDSHPVFYDYNRDGKPDLFIGSRGYYLPTGAQRGKIQYFQNTSTAGNAQFQFVTDNMANVWNTSPDGAIPAFGDVDGDGKDDMLVGRDNGTISFYRNTAPAVSNPPQWVLSDLTMRDSLGGSIINVGGTATPLLYDLNKDGKKDLIIGTLRGTLRCYINKNTSAGVASFGMLTDTLGGVVVEPLATVGGFSAPFIGKIDSTGKEYLLVGSSSGNLYLFDSIVSNNLTLPFRQLSNRYAGIRPAERSVPAVADVDGDGRFEMVVGNEHGGVHLYRSGYYTALGTGSPVAAAADYLELFPNPAAAQIAVRWGGQHTGTASLRVYDLTGRLVYQTTTDAAAGAAAIPVGDWVNGLYLLTLQAGGVRNAARFSVVH